MIEHLKRANALLVTNDFQIQMRDKNKRFERQYPLKNDQKVKILRSLKSEDCVDIAPNDNPRYPDNTVFKFIKKIEETFYGEKKEVTLYIKQYIVEKKDYELLMVISFHEEGDYDM